MRWCKLVARKSHRRTLEKSVLRRANLRIVSLAWRTKVLNEQAKHREEKKTGTVIKRDQPWTHSVVRKPCLSPTSWVNHVPRLLGIIYIYIYTLFQLQNKRYVHIHHKIQHTLDTSKDCHVIQQSPTGARTWRPTGGLQQLPILRRKRRTPDTWIYASFKYDCCEFYRSWNSNLKKRERKGMVKYPLANSPWKSGSLIL